MVLTVVPESELENRVREFWDACRAAGLRITPQRTEIFRELVQTDEHPDAESVHNRIRDRMPNVSLDTVYRTLALLEEYGLIRKVEVFSERLRYDPNMKQHHHFVCSRCGAIYDIHDRKLNRVQPSPKTPIGGEVESVHVQFRGICSKCKSRS